MRKSSSKFITYTALLSAILCVVSPLTIPIGAVPISFTTLAIFITASIVDYKISTLATLIYIFIGIIGLPVFSNFQGGVSVLFNGTGGFILGYTLCAFITSFMVKKSNGRKSVFVLAMVLSTLILYIIGTAWFIVIAKVDFISAIIVCVLPFILFDAIKIIVATLIFSPLRKSFVK